MPDLPHSFDSIDVSPTPFAQPLELRLQAASPRYRPPPTPLVSILIHFGALLLWAVLFAMAFHAGGLLAWSVGVAYITYDTLLLSFVFWQTWSLRKNPALGNAPLKQPRAASGHTTLGIVVAAHNEMLVLPVTLAALLSQSDAPDLIVIADDGSTDGTAELLQRVYGLALPEWGMLGPASAAHPTLRWLRLPHGGKARALNAAISQINTDTVLTVDADTLLEPDAIGAVRAAFAADNRLVAATGVLAPVCDRSWRGRLFQWFQTYEYIRSFLSRYAWMQVGGLLLISGAFAGFRRSALLEVGGFDDDCLVEDYELIHRLHRFSALNGRGWSIQVLGDARARTEAPAGIGAFLRQRQRWFGGFLQTQLWYRDMVGNRRYGALGLAMLPVKAIDTLQPLYGLTAFVLLLVYIGDALAGALFGPAWQGVSAAGGMMASDNTGPVLGAVALVISGKIVVDVLFHLWSVRLYQGWAESQGGLAQPGQSKTGLGWAFLAALAEPFTFQILRHLGAIWGWLGFLTGARAWGRQSRGGLLPPQN